MKNSIPEMTNPLGKYWEQPNVKEILIENNNAIMTGVTFNKLKNYSHSIPSGVYVGKMWRGVSREGINFLAWYGESDKPNECLIHRIEIILID